MAAVNLFLCGARLRHGNLRRQACVGVKTRPQLFASSQKVLCYLDGGKLFRLDAFRKLAEWQEGDILDWHREISLVFLCRRSGLFLAFYKRLQIQRWPVPIFDRVGAQPVARRLVPAVETG